MDRDVPIKVLPVFDYGENAHISFDDFVMTSLP
jgi:hypothetical protein